MEKKKKIKVYFLVFGLLLLYLRPYAQNSDGKYFNKSYIGFLPSATNGGNAFSKQRGTLITTVNGINLTPNFSAGMGIGIGGYVNPTFTSIPLFLDANYYFLKKVSTPYVYGDFGYSFSTSDFISGGILLEGGIGWKFKITNKFNLGPQLGYRVQSINKEYESLKSISIGVAAKF